MEKFLDNYETIKWINIVLIVMVIYLFLFFLFKKIMNRNFYYKTNIPIINSQDNNISNGKIDEITQNWLKYLKSDLKFEYLNTTKYVKICNHLDLQQKTIKTPKWYMPSIGYELEYILGSIWFAHWLYKSNQIVVTAKKIMSTRPLIFNLIFISCIVIAICFYLIGLNFFNSFEIEKIKLNLYSLSIIFCLMSFISHILTILNYKNSLKYKNDIEIAFSTQLYDFFSKHYQEYYNDLLSARNFSFNIWNSFDLSSFLVNKKTNNLKYFGPFVIL